MATSKSHLPRITILGSLNIDLVSYVPHHPAPGETLTATSFAVSPGGKGANQAVACAKLSRPRTTSTSTSAGPLGPPDDAGATAHVSMVGAVGDDSYGDILLTNLSRHGVEVSAVRRPPGLKTGIAIIIVDQPTGQNRIVLSAEANHLALQPADVFPSLPPADTSSPSSDWSGITRDAATVALTAALGGGPLPDLLIMQLEIPLPTVLAALRAARAAGAAVLLNPAPAQPLPDEVLAGLAHLVVNETEAAILSGREVSALDTEAGMEEVALGFAGLGVRNVVITLGDRGCYYLSGETGERGLVPAEKARVVDTTGAGDTFVGMYALDVVAVGEGAKFDVGRAVRRAIRAATKTVERKGAQDSIPWRDELEQ
ncbi:Ribokinase [Pleurostoma richardsiae]|uniref:Ribokinase n=1 Tax=Pleurostoma richardsiae TaxID=41990 RepID=A0AA38RVT0_9PEZI|nr:Ribokinase [Pleurostoma richardsiae]